MIDVHYYFFEYLYDLIGAYCREPEFDDKMIEFQRISPTPEKPYRFFQWFFSHHLKANKHPLHSGGQSLFVSYFNDLPKVLDDIIELNKVDDLSYNLEFNDNSDPKNCVVKKKLFHFEEAISALLQKEFLAFKAQLKENLSKIGNVIEKRSSLIHLYLEIKDFKIVSQHIDKNYNAFYKVQFELYKEKMAELVVTNLPVIENKIPEGLLEKHAWILKLKHVYNKLEIHNRLVVNHDRTSINDLSSLFINRDLSKKAYFNCSQASLAYILQEIFKGKIKLNKYCNAHCLWFMHDDEFCVVSKPGNFYAAKSRLPLDEKEQIDNFFKSLQ